MLTTKVGLASLNTTVGAVRTNTVKIKLIAREMAEAQCQFGLFQEGTFGGYHAEDLNTWKQMRVVQMKYLRNFVEDTVNYRFPTIFLVCVTMDLNGRAANVVVVVSQGRIWAIIPKLDLPGDGVFYDPRVFEEGDAEGYIMVVPYKGHDPVPYGNVIIDVGGVKVSASICETVWHPEHVQVHSYNDSLIDFGPSSSPFRIGVFQTLNEMLATRSGDSESVIVYASQVGAQDSLVFHGLLAIYQNGRPKLFTRWKEQWVSLVIDLDEVFARRAQNVTWAKNRKRHLAEHGRLAVVAVTYPDGFELPTYVPDTNSANKPFLPPITSVLPEINVYEDVEMALVMGLGDYVDKVGIFQCLILGDSGGIDSQLVKIIAWLYARKRFSYIIDETERAITIHNFVRCYSMPTQYNGSTTKSIALRMSAELDVHFEEYPIQDAYEREKAALKEMLPPGVAIDRITDQNIMPRIRGPRLHNLANVLHGLVLNTSNQTEEGVGYCTIGGDSLGGKGVINAIVKTFIYAFARHLGKKYGIQVMDDVLATKASAELAYDQEDEKDLMPFEIMDSILELFVGSRSDAVSIYTVLRAKYTDEDLRKMAPSYKPGMLKTWVKRYLTLFFTQVFKWVILPQGIFIGPIVLDYKRALQIPVVTSLEWLELEALDILPD